mgnify:CR=1 FL=1
MCGIAGIIGDISNKKIDIIRNMISALIHRGPDAQRILKTDNSLLAFSRLKIIDFNNLPNGLLGITVKAVSKVSLNNIIQLEDKSYLGEVSPLTEQEVDDQSLIAKYL